MPYSTGFGASAAVGPGRLIAVGPENIFQGGCGTTAPGGTGEASTLGAPGGTYGCAVDDKDCPDVAESPVTEFSRVTGGQSAA